MKKVLLASTVLAMTTTFAAADGLTLSGYGRFGLDYNSRPAVGDSKTMVNMRMRINIDGSKETDSGVTFGGRVRLQYQSGSTAAELSPAKLYASYAGFRMEVGNVDTAYDSAALMYNSEIGYLDRGYGDPIGNFYSFSSGPYGALEADRMGVAATYSIAGANVRVSYVNPDQTLRNLPVGTRGEVGISADYKFNQFTVSAAYVDNVGSVDTDRAYFLGAEYAINDMANVGLLYNNLKAGAPSVTQERVTLYGNYKMDAITVKGYVAHDNLADNNLAPNATKTAFGLGVDYDLGGARLAGDIHRNYAKQTIVGAGVRFDF